MVLSSCNLDKEMMWLCLFYYIMMKLFLDKISDKTKFRKISKDATKNREVKQKNAFEKEQYFKSIS